MKGAFLSWQRSQRADARTDQPRRTVAQLWSLAEAAATVRQQAQAAKHKKVEQAQRAKRETFLRMLAANVELQWRSADKDAQRAVASGYDAALRTITDLSEAYALGKRTDFDRALAAFMRQHGTRTALVRRLVAAGLWRKAK